MSVTLATILYRQAHMCHHLGLAERGIRLCEESVALLHDVEHSTRRDSVAIQAKLRLGVFLCGFGHTARGKQLYREALALANQLGVPRHKEYALLHLGNHARSQGQYREAKRLLRQAVTIANQTGEQACKASSLNSLGWVFWAKGKYQRAQMMAEESLQIFKEIGGQGGKGFGFVLLGEIATALGKYELAAQHFQGSLAMVNDISQLSVNVKVESLLGQGTLALVLGHHAEARQLFEEALAPVRDSQNRIQSPAALAGLGHAACGLGELQQARRCFDQALEGAMAMGMWPIVADALVGVACLAIQEGEPRRAVEFLTLTLQHSATTKITRDRAERMLGELRSELSAGDLAAATARGRAHELEGIIASVLRGSASESATV